MHNIFVIMKKQFRDTLKNKTILVQFLMFPMLTLVMENAIHIKDMPEHFFVKLFAVMFIGMAPLTAATAILSEEKEKNTLRVLMMADMKPWQYLTGVGSYIWLICMAGAGVMASCIETSGRLFFLGMMGIGIAISIVAGACIGIFSKNQMMATSLQMPCMMIFSFAPMLAMFNEDIRRISDIFYTQQLKCVFDQMSLDGFGTNGAMIVCVNAVICVIMFAVAYRKKGLE